MKVVIYSDDGNVIEFNGDTCIVTSGNQTYIGGITEASEIFNNIVDIVYSGYTSLSDLLVSNEQGETYNFDMYVDDIVNSLKDLRRHNFEIDSSHTTMEIDKMELLKQVLDKYNTEDLEKIRVLLKSLGYKEINLSKEEIQKIIDKYFNNDKDSK